MTDQTCGRRDGTPPFWAATAAPRPANARITSHPRTGTRPLIGILLRLNLQTRGMAPACAAGRGVERRAALSRPRHGGPGDGGQSITTRSPRSLISSEAGYMQRRKTIESSRLVWHEPPRAVNPWLGG